LFEYDYTIESFVNIHIIALITEATLNKKFPNHSFISSENFDEKNKSATGVVATQTQCSSSQNSGCRSHNTSGDMGDFLEISMNSPARKKA